MSEIIDYILQFITTKNARFIEDLMHSWDILRALSERLASTDVERRMENLAQYRKLLKGLDMQDIEAYLIEWEHVYTELLRLKGKTIDKSEMIHDFLVFISERANFFFEKHLDAHDADDLYEIVRKFRNWIRIKEAKDVAQKHTNSAFSAFGPTFNEKSPDEYEANQGQKGEKREKGSCVCDMMHRWTDCFYLVPERRSINWTPKPTIQKKVDEALTNQQLVNAIIKYLKEFQARKKRKNQRVDTNNPTLNSSINDQIELKEGI